MYSMKYDERAAEGAALLDRRRPGWEGDIDLASLNVGSSTACVLGQLYGSYGSGVYALELAATDDRVARGFTRKGDSGDSYRGLNAAWRRLIQARRGVSHGS
jgi:hypothetical protein